MNYYFYSNTIDLLSFLTTGYSCSFGNLYYNNNLISNTVNISNTNLEGYFYCGFLPYIPLPPVSSEFSYIPRNYSYIFSLIPINLSLSNILYETSGLLTEPVSCQNNQFTVIYPDYLYSNQLYSDFGNGKFLFSISNFYQNNICFLSDSKGELSFVNTNVSASYVLVNDDTRFITNDGVIRGIVYFSNTVLPNDILNGLKLGTCPDIVNDFLMVINNWSDTLVTSFTYNSTSVLNLYYANFDIYVYNISNLSYSNTYSCSMLYSFDIPFTSCSYFKPVISPNNGYFGIFLSKTNSYPEMFINLTSGIVVIGSSGKEYDINNNTFSILDSTYELTEVPISGSSTQTTSYTASGPYYTNINTVLSSLLVNIYGSTDYKQLSVPTYTTFRTYVLGDNNFLYDSSKDFVYSSSTVIDCLANNGISVTFSHPPSNGPVVCDRSKYFVLNNDLMLSYSLTLNDGSSYSSGFYQYEYPRFLCLNNYRCVSVIDSYTDTTALYSTTFLNGCYDSIFVQVYSNGEISGTIDSYTLFDNIYRSTSFAVLGLNESHTFTISVNPTYSNTFASMLCVIKDLYGNVINSTNEVYKWIGYNSNNIVNEYLLINNNGIYYNMDKSCLYEINNDCSDVNSFD